MKHFLPPRLLFAIAILAISLTSCELIWPEQSPQYWYYVQNNTHETLEVTLQLAPSNAYITGSNTIHWFISPGKSFNVWGYSGSEEDGRVYDYEKDQPRLLYFKQVSIKGDGSLSQPRTDFTATKRWQYKKVKAYEASYTLTVNTDDFY